MVLMRKKADVDAMGYGKLIEKDTWGLFRYRAFLPVVSEI